MKRLSAFLIAVTLIISITALAGCKDQDKTQEVDQSKTELEKAQMELEQIKQDSTKLDSYINDLKTQINNLKIQNQKLIAESKRLEAEIIDLKLELGQIPNSDSPKEETKPSDEDKNVSDKGEGQS